MPGSPKTIPRTGRQFSQLVLEVRQRIEADAQFAHLLGVLCGSPALVQRFTQSPGGVGISAFSELVGLPTSTVRHYQRLGLITPYEVGGKFRFWFHNLVQVESVRQWRDLGLSLPEIQEQSAQERLGGQAVTFNLAASLPSRPVPSKVLGLGLGAATKLTEFQQFRPYTVWLPLGDERMQVTARQAFQDTRGVWSLDLQRVQAEVRAARSRLEGRLEHLQAQLQRARQLEAALSSISAHDLPPEP